MYISTQPCMQNEEQYDYAGLNSGVTVLVFHPSCMSNDIQECREI